MLVKYRPEAVTVGKLPPRNGPYSIGKHWFYTGTNQIAEKDWQALMQNPNYKKAIQSRIDLGVLTIESKPEGVAPTVEATLASYPEAKAKAMIKDTTNIELLNSWLDEDLKAPVLKALRARIREFDAPQESV